MKLILISLLLGGLPPWFCRTLLPPEGEKGPTRSAQTVIVAEREGGSAEAPCVLKVRGNTPCVLTTSGGSAPCIVSSAPGKGLAAYVVAFGDDPEEGRSTRRLVWTAGKDTGEERGWLGVSIGEVPESLAAQLGIQGRGIVVRNVVEGSPADSAGIQVHDVILSVDGEAIEGGVGGAVDLIKSRKPGDKVDIELLREGREKTITVELGSRSEAKSFGFDWKFEDIPDADVEESIVTRGKIIRRLGDGKWVVEDLDEDELLEGLPSRIKMFLPKSGSRRTQVFIHDDRKKVETKVQRDDGSTIVISREDDGPIKVTRTDEEGNETTATYDDEDELRDADEEAYELWRKTGESVEIHLNLDSLGKDLHRLGEDLEGLKLDLDLDFDADELKEHMKEWQEHWRESLESAREAYEEAMKELHEQMERWKKGEGFPDDFGFRGWPMFLDKDEAGDFPGFMALRHRAKPRHTFELRADGTIEVRIRKGDSELVRLYENEDDLARRNPKLYEKYEKLMTTEEEKE